MLQQNHNKKIPVLLYAPNILGYVRIVLSFTGLYYSILQHQPVNAVIVWIIACSLDLLDGMVARYLHQTSKFGILLDIVADNILRTCVWMATSNAASIYYYRTMTYPDLLNYVPTSLVSSQYAAIAIMIMSCFLICIEWITMISTQVHAAATRTAAVTAATTTTTTNATTNKETHWKQRRDQQDHGIVQYFFSNNFCNPLGCIGIYGLFAFNLFLYGCYHPILYSNIPYYNIWLYLAFIGRLVSLCIELHFCYKFISFVIQDDDAPKNK